MRGLPAIVRIAIFLGYIVAGGALITLLGCVLLGGKLPTAGNMEAAVSDSSVSFEEWDTGVQSEQPAAAEVSWMNADRSYPSGGERLVLTAFAADGSMAWEYVAECGSRISANGSEYDTLEWMENGGIVYVNNAAEEVMTALDYNTGKVLWRLDGVFGCPVVYDFGADGTLYIGSTNEFYGPGCVAVSADGRELWRVTRYFTTCGITACDDHVQVDFDDMGYFYTVNFDFDGNELGS